MGNVLLKLCLPCMRFIGFTARGVKKGSLAALIHSWHGVVKVGSCFARCQSAAATSGPCGCILVAVFWISIFLGGWIWIFGLPLWFVELKSTVTNGYGTMWNSTFHGVQDGAAELWNKTKEFSSNGTHLNATIDKVQDIGLQVWNSTKQFTADGTDLFSDTVMGLWNRFKYNTTT